MGDKPKRAYRAGAVSVSVFENVQANKKGEQFTSLSFSVQRAYTEDEGKSFKHTNSFKLNDVPKLSHLLDLAYGDAVKKEKEE